MKIKVRIPYAITPYQFSCYSEIEITNLNTIPPIGTIMFFKYGSFTVTQIQYIFDFDDKVIQITIYTK